jgi:hypothetical protein
VTLVRYLHLLAMAFFVGGQLFLVAALVAEVAGLIVWHMRRPQMHALEGAPFPGLLAIAWLGVSLAH